MAQDRSRALWPFLSGLLAFFTTEILFAVIIGTPWRSDGTTIFTEALVVALPLALPLLFAGAGVGLSLRRHGAWSMLPAAVAAPCVVIAVTFNLDWLAQAGHDVHEAVLRAYHEHGFFMFRWLWQRLHGISTVIMFPVLVVLFFADFVLLPFVVLLTPEFLMQVSMFVVKSGLLAAGGLAVSAILCAPVLLQVAKKRAASVDAAR